MHIVISFVLFLFGSIYSLINIQYGIIIVEFSIIYLVIVSFFSFYKQYKNLLNPHNIFLFMFSFFLLPRVFLDLFDLESISQTVFFSNYNFSTATIFRSCVNIYIAIFSFVISSLYFLNKKGWDFNSEKNVMSYKYYKIGRMMLLMCLPFLLLYMFTVFNFINTHGYIAFHLGEEKIPYSSFFKIVISLAILGFSFFAISNPVSKSTYWLFTVLLMISLISDGRRGPGLTFGIVSFWYYCYYRKIEIKLLKLVLIGVSVIGLAVVVGGLRFNKELNQMDFSLIDFIYGQGISFQVIGYTIEEIKQIDYTFLDLFNNVTRTVNVMVHKIIGGEIDLGLKAKAKDDKLFSSYISYVVNSETYLSGFGIGGSYVAQFFAVGREYAQLLLGLVFGFFYTKIIFLVKSRSPYKKAFVIISLPSLIYIPRDNVMDFITDFLMTYIFLIIIFFILKIKKITSKYRGFEQIENDK